MIKKSTPSRIINVSSLAHWYYHLDLEDLDYEKRAFSAWSSYAQSKLCNVLFTKELSRMMKGKGKREIRIPHPSDSSLFSGVTVNALHPGAVHTEIASKDGSLLGKLFSAFIGISSKVKNMSDYYFIFET